MRRIAMKIAYDGTIFHGQARQPGLATVEGEVLKALSRAHAIGDVRAARFQSASRTDRGVSALGNVVAFDASFPPVATVRAFNSKSRGIWAWAVAEVPLDFSARRATERWYQYELPGNHDASRLTEALRVFVGEHDFRNFTRDRERTVLRIEGAGVRREGASCIMDFRARRFAWNLVRRLVSAVLRVEAGDTTVRDLERALRTNARIDFGLAPPEPLTLRDVRYAFEFQSVRDPTTAERIRRILEERLRDAGFYSRLEGRFRDGNGFR